MSIGVILFDALMLVTMAAVIASSRRAWRNEHPWFDTDCRVRWSGGYPSWRGWVRVQGVIAPTVFAGGAVIFVVQSTGVHGGAWEAARAIAGLVLFVVLGAGAGVWLFNRPKWLVAPHLRHQPGMVAELLGERCKPTPTPRPRRRRRGPPDAQPRPLPPADG